MSRPTPLSGFPELLPAERNAETYVIDHLRRTFELHGFASVETRAVEPLDRLAKGGEIDKEVYVLRRLHADEGGDSGLGMHFDLTVPFARYVLEHAGKLEFPFRRYQIQKVWRGERPQEGRFREFTQADIDVVARDELPFHADVEVATVMAEALSGLPVPNLHLQVNNRRLLEGFYVGLGLTDPAAAMRAVDKLDKLPRDKVGDLLRSDAGASADQAEACLRLAEIRTHDASFADRVRELGVKHELLDRGIDELVQVMDALSGLPLEGVTVTADLRIARGLDYYTGTVFETRMEGFDGLGSVCSGGRYDALASDGKTTYPGVGISLGITRMLVPLIHHGVLTSSRSVPSAVLVALVDEASRPQSNAIAQRLRARGIPTEVAASAQKYGKQIRYAERRGIPYVFFPGDPAQPDQVKDIRSGDQVDADADTWRPRDEDLRPTIVTPESAIEEQAK
ncbi:histidine--tRNA ligase [Solicola gregarius]|uniref:Histidine--tRNA ligase n=1 Tax=Solicola gregarius TaxID=2908642 RepID=A0AA46TG97_9ACTN|nr:histidine--tRNA ligase [Solicola gregarius]UYM04809.1 histidine--tRNA ligase [Solicola gregarius]